MLTLFLLNLSVYQPAYAQTSIPVRVHVTEDALIDSEFWIPNDTIPLEQSSENINLLIQRGAPLLPKYLIPILEQVSFHVAHNIGLTKTYLGFSAEDDPEYTYPRTDFLSPNGIRVVFTEKFLKFLDYGRTLKENSPEAEGFHGFAVAILAHELMHAYQYHTGPVQDFARAPESCFVADSTGLAGLCSKAIIASTRKKIGYEHDAFGVERGILKQYANQVQALATYMIADELARPDIFAKGGELFLLSSKNKNPFAEHYLRGESKLAPLGTEFSPRAKIYYDAQYRLPEMAWEAKERADQGARCDDKDILKAWRELTDFLTPEVDLLGDAQFRYAIPVVERIRFELGRCID